MIYYTVMNKFMTVAEVAEYLNLTRQGVYKLINRIDNPLPAIKISSQTIRISSDNLEAWLAGVFDNPNYEPEQKQEGGED